MRKVYSVLSIGMLNVISYLGNSTRKRVLSALLCMVCLAGMQKANAQIGVTISGATNTTPNLASSYTSFANFVTALNGVTAVSGSVTATLSAGSSETAPVKGFNISTSTANVFTTTNTLTIVKASGAATVINAGVGTSAGPTATPDGMLYLSGMDGVTIDGLTFTDGNTASSTVAMEYGIAFFKRAAGDGCNGNTVKNCTFNMQRINFAAASSPMANGSFGIQVLNSTAAAATTALTPTNGGTLASNGTNSNNTFQSNTFNNGNGGINITGFAASSGVGPTPTATTFLGDINNLVGGSSSGLGNTILNYGGGASATTLAVGINLASQWSATVRYNVINNNNGSGVNHVSTLNGILVGTATSANILIDNNTVTLKAGGTTSAVTAISNAAGSTASSNTVTITNNIVQNCTYTTATTATFTGILTSATALNVNVNSNQILTNAIGASGTASACTFQGIYNSGSSTNFTANSNTITGNSLLNSFGTIHCIRGSTSTITVDGNTISNISIPNNASSTLSTIYAYYDVSAPVIENVTNNNINNLTISGSNTASTNVIYGIYNLTTAGAKNFSGNNINNLSFTSSGAGSASVIGIRNAYTATSTIAKNIIHTLSSTGTTPTVSGIYLGASTATTFNVYNNLIGNLSTPASTGMNLSGIFCGAITSTMNIYYNTIYLNGTSTGTGFASAAIFMSSTLPTVTLNNNILVNLSTPTGTGITAALRGTSTALTGYGSSSNNNLFFAGTPSATRVIYYDGTAYYGTSAASFSFGAASTTGTFQNKVSPRESNSFTETVSSTAGVFFQSLTGPATGTSTSFLHLVNSLNTRCEGGGIAISGITDDVDGNTRNASNPDVGADEFVGVSPAPANASLTVPSNVCTAGSGTVISVTPTTPSGTITSVTISYNNGTAAGPFAMTNSSGTYSYTIPEPTSGGTTVTWSITSSNSLSLSTTTIGSSYVYLPIAGAAATAAASVSPVCVGSSTSLSVSVKAPGGTAIVGTGTTLTTATTQPTAFCNRWASYRMQQLYTAAELQAAGLIAGNITAIAFNITSLGDAATNANFRVKIGNSALSALTAFVDTTTGFTTVYTPKTYTHTASGWQVITFDAPFNWDGTSNIVLQVVHDGANSTNNSITYYTSTVANTVAYTSTAATNSASLATTRLNTTFYGVAPVTPSSVSWSNGTGVIGTNSPLVISPSSTLTYTPTANISGCTISATGVSVTVNAITASPTNVTTSPQCGLPTYTITTEVSSPTIKWYAASSGGSAIAGATSLAYTPGTYTGGGATNTYWATVTDASGCESPRVACAAVANDPTAVTISPTGSQTTCVGTIVPISVTSTLSNYSSYIWSPSTNLYTNSSATTPYDGTTSTFTTIYYKRTSATSSPETITLTATGGGCTATATASFTVNANPVITSVTATPSSVCSGSTVSLAGAIFSQSTFNGARTAPANIGNTTPFSYGLVFDASSAFTLNSVDVFNGSTSSGTFVIQLQDNTGTVLQTSSTFTAPAGTGVIGTTTPYTAALGWSVPVGTAYRLLVTSGSASLVRESSLGGFPYALGSVGSITSGYISGTSTTYYFLYNWNITASTNASANYAWSWASTLTGPAIASGSSSSQIVTNATESNVTGTYTATATLNGCSGSLQSSVVTVKPLPSAPNASETSVQCGSGIPTVSVSSNTSNTPKSFSWYAASTGGTALQTSSSTTYSSSINATTTFYVTETVSGCESATRTPASVTVNSADGLTATASQTTGVCLGSSINLSVNQSGSTNNYVFTWTASPQVGSGVPSGGTSGSAITITPTASGTYTYTITGVDIDRGCTNTSTIQITVINPTAGITASATASASPICAGSSTNLSLVLTKNGSGTVGSGASTASTYDNPFNSSWSHTQQQILVKASELTAAGLSAGNITALSLFVTSGTTIMPDFSLGIQHTSATALSTLATTGFTTVYSNSTGVTPVIGTNTITFTNAFAWDGTSNILLKFCWGNSSTTATQSNTVTADATSYVCSVNAHNTTATSGSSICGSSTVYLTYSNRPKFTFSGNFAPTPSAYSWSDGSTVVGSTNPLTVTPSSTKTYTPTATISGCTIVGTGALVTVNALPTAPSAGTPSVQCGAGIPTVSVSSNTSNTPKSFSWYAAATGGTALQTDPSTTYKTSINTTSIFYVTEIVNGCESSRTAVSVTVNSADGLTAAASKTSGVCLGTTVDLSATKSGTTNTYVYTWTASPQAGSGISVSGTSGKDITITPTAAGTYTYTITGIDATLGCSNTSTVQVTVINPLVGASSSASVSVNPICSGSPTNLSVSVFAPGGTAIVGTGTSLTSATSQPTAFCNRWGSYRMQLLYTAAELQAAGLAAGNITAIAFDITSLGDAATNSSFRVKVGNTTLTALTAFVDTTSGFTSVFTPKTYTHTATGLQVITFDAPFNWDGTSNIVLQVVHNGANSTNNSTTYYTTTVANTVAYTSTAATNSASLSTSRLNTTFYGVGSITPTAFSWSDGTSVVGTTNPLTVSPTSTKTYTATSTVSGCPISSNGVAVTVNALPSAPTNNSTVSAQCGIPTYRATGAGSGSSYRWYTVSSGGTAIVGATSGDYIYTNYPVSAGVNSLWVSIVNASGCESARTQIDVTVSQPTAVNATINGHASTSTACFGQNITLAVSSSNTSYAYSWTSVTTGNGLPSGAGTSSTSNTSKVATPTATGTIIYTLTANDGFCTTISTLTATVNVLPSAASIDATNSQICTGGSTSVSVVAGTIASGPQTLPTYSCVTGSSLHSFTGTYVTNLTVGSLNYTTSSTTAYNVYGSASSPLVTLNAGSTYTISNTYAGSPYQVGVWIDYDRSGTFESTEYVEVLAYSTSNPANSSMSFTLPTSLTSGVTVLRIRTRTSSFASTDACTSFASGQTQDYVINVQGFDATGVTYLWSPGGATTSTINVTPSSTTKYTVTFTQNGCSNTADTTITVLPLPVKPTVSTPVSICGSTSKNLTLTNVASLTSNDIVKWYDASTGGNLLYTGVPYPTPTIFGSTTYYIEVTNGTCTNNGGRTAIALNYSTAPALTVNTGSTLCGVGTSIDGLSVTSTIGNYNSYVWSPVTNLYSNAGATTSYTGVSANTVYAKPSAAGTTTFTLTATNSTTGCVNTATRTVTVNATPTISVNANPTDILTGASSALSATVSAGTINWTIPPSTTSLSTASTYNTGALTSSTTYQATATSNGCTNSATVTVNVVGCAPPTIGTPTVSSNTAASIPFTGNLAALSYVYRYRVQGTTTWTTGSITASPISLTGLLGGYTYEIQVGSTCSGSTSNYSASTNFTLQNQPLNTYTIARNTNVSYSSIAQTGSPFTGWAINGTYPTDENTSGALTLPSGFNFRYQGKLISSLRANVNGYVVLDEGYTDQTSISSTAISVHPRCLAPFVADLVTAGNPGSGNSGNSSVILNSLNSSILYQISGTTGSRVLTVEWIGMEKFVNAGPNLNFQVKLYEGTNKIEFVYGDMWPYIGNTSTAWTYRLGISDYTSGSTYLNQQASQVLNFAQSTTVSNVWVPKANTSLSFTPGTTVQTYSASALTVTNDEPTTATDLLSVISSSGNLSSLPVGESTDFNASQTLNGYTNNNGLTNVNTNKAKSDVWYKITATSTTDSIFVRLLGSSNVDGKLELRDGTTYDLLNAVTTSSSANGATSTMSATGLTCVSACLPTSVGQVILARVINTGTAATTDNIIISAWTKAVPLVNDDCSGAIALTIGTPLSSGSTSNATVSANVPANCGGSTSAGDVWYKFTATSTYTNVSVVPGAGFNLGIELWNGGSGGGSCITNSTATTNRTCLTPTGAGQTRSQDLTTVVGNTYYLRVYSGASGGITPSTGFTITVSTPLPSCATGLVSLGTSRSAQVTTPLTWTAATNATSYSVVLADNSSYTSPIVNTTVSTTSYTVPANTFSAGTTYYWKVTAIGINGSATGCSSNTAQFSTLGSTPSCVSIVSPANGSSGSLASDGITFSWTAGSGNPTGYDVYLSTNQALVTTNSVSARIAQGIGVTSYNTLTNGISLLNGTTYYWKVNPVNSNGTNSGCAANSFTTRGNLIVSNTQSISGSYINVTVTSTGVATLSNALDVTGTLTVENGGTLILGNNTVTGTEVNIKTGANLSVGSTLGIAAVGSSTGNIRTNTRTIANGINVTYNGTAAQITGSGLPTSVNSLTINNNAGVTINSGSSTQLNVTGVLYLTTGTLTTNGLLTLKSTSIANSAVVAPVSGAVNGNVIVERYIPKGYRAWRDMSASVFNAGSIYNNWQEGGSYGNAGYGLFITGTTATTTSHGVDATNGLDQTVNSVKSAYNFSNAGVWTAVTNTKTTSLNPYTGYRVLVRGDRTFNLYTTPISTVGTTGMLLMVNSTALRATGRLITGNVVYTKTGVTNTVSGSTYNSASFGLNGTTDTSFSSVGNPYVAPIDWKNMYDNGRVVNLRPAYYYLDPTIGSSGAYVTYNAFTDVASNLATGARYIQAGQAIFVQNNASTSPSLTITEADKAISSTKTSVFGSTASRSKLAISLMKAEGSDWKKMDASVVVFDSRFSNDIRTEDAVKMMNNGENLAIVNKGQMLSIEGRQPAQAEDIVPLSLDKMTTSTYSLNIDASAYKAEGLDVYLADAFGNTTTALKTEANQISFQVDAANAATYANRFSILFKAAAKTATVTPIAAASLSVYPNPMVGKSVTVRLGSEAVAGKYVVTMYNSLGQKVHESIINHNGTNAGQLITTASKLVAGAYNISIQSADTNKVVATTTLAVE